MVVPDGIPNFAPPPTMATCSMLGSIALPARRSGAPLPQLGARSSPCEPFPVARFPADASPARRHGRPPHRREAGGARGARGTRRGHGQVRRRRFAIPVQGLPLIPGGTATAATSRPSTPTGCARTPPCWASPSWAGPVRAPAALVAACAPLRRARRSRRHLRPRRSAVQHPRLGLRRQVPVRPVHGFHRLQPGSCLCVTRRLSARVTRFRRSCCRSRAAPGLRAAPSRACGSRHSASAAACAASARRLPSGRARHVAPEPYPAVGDAVRAHAAPIAVGGHAPGYPLPRAPSVPLRLVALRVCWACRAREADAALPLPRLRRRTGRPARRWTTSSGCTVRALRRGQRIVACLR